MKAVVRQRYGGPDVLEYRDVPDPVPTGDEVLVRVRAASVNAGDWHLMRGEPLLVRLFQGGLFRPGRQGLGWDLAGRVESVGEDVERFRAGDEVFGCGSAAFAEYASAAEAGLTPMPAGVGFEEAAAVPTAGLTALQGLRDHGGLEAGMDVLVIGASGGVGTFAVQIARGAGARVTGVCSTEKLDLVRSLGAEDVIDYTREDFTRGDRRWDLILDTAAHRPIRKTRRALSPDGIYVLVGGPARRTLGALLLGPVLSAAGRGRVTAFIAGVNRDDLVVLGDMLAEGEIAPALDRSYELARLPDAIRYLEEGRARGKVVVSV